jgi:hypothetical protein
VPKIVLKQRSKRDINSPHPSERYGHPWSELWCEGEVLDRRTGEWVSVHPRRRIEEAMVIGHKGKTYDLCRVSCEPRYREWGYGTAAASTGGSPMKTKNKKEKRTSAADVLVEQFALKVVKSNEELIKLVREATGSKKFDDKQLAWYKSQYRAGKLKGMNGKAGHLIAQGKLTKEAHTRRPKSSSKAKVVVKKKAAKKEAEPVE